MLKVKFRRIVIYSTLFLFLALVWKFVFTPTHPKNLLLISIDTLRPDHMGVYGYGKDTTPNIDKWAKSAAVFTNAATAVPMTHPSRAALFTGKDPAKTRIISNSGLLVSENNKTLTSILAQNGFFTAGYSTIGSALDQGFEVFNTHEFKSFYYNGAKAEYNERFTMTERADYEKFILSSADILKSSKDGGRFFLWVHLVDPHAPYFAPGGLRCKFNSKFCDEISGKNLEELEELRAQYQSCQNNPVPQDRIELMEALYDGEVAAADRLVGKILDNLKELGLDKNTLVVLYGDHGEGFDHNYYFNHRQVLYDSSIKIPLIIFDPAKGRSGEKSDVLIQDVDILPTILDFLGIDYKKGSFDGKSFAGQFGKFSKIIPAPRKRAIFANSYFSKFAIVRDNLKYIYSLPQSCLLESWHEELYDLVADPNETKNLAGERTKELGKLRDDLLEYLSDYNLPIEWKSNEVPGQFSTEDDSAGDLRSIGY